MAALFADQEKLQTLTVTLKDRRALLNALGPAELGQCVVVKIAHRQAVSAPDRFGEHDPPLSVKARRGFRLSQPRWQRQIRNPREISRFSHCGPGENQGGEEYSATHIQSLPPARWRLNCQPKGFLMRALVFALASGCVLGCATATAPASASEAPTIQSCLANAEDDAGRRACIGIVNLSCQDEGDGGATTTGMVICAERERAQWAAVGEAASATLASQESATQRAARTRAATAHAAWQQARCAYDASLYEGGSLARYSAAACMMGETADFALILYERTLGLP